MAALAFSPGAGELLAVAASYTWERGAEPGTPADAIVIRRVADADVRPRARPPLPGKAPPPSSVCTARG